MEDSRPAVTRTLRAVAAAAALGALLAAPAPAAHAAGFGQEKFKVGDKAPDFALADTKGRTVRLSDAAGKEVVLLAFFAMRCGACLAEAPHLERLHRTYDDQGLALIGVNTDGVDAATLAETLAATGVTPTYPILLDPEFAVSDTYTNFIVPLTVIVDRGGVIRYIHTGYEDGLEKEYEKALRAALGS